MATYDALLARTIDSAETWTSILNQLSNPHPLQSWAWGELKARWGWEMQPTVWELNGQPLAAAMLLKKRFGQLPICMLYAPKGPILDYENADLRRRVLNSLQVIAKSERAIFLKIDPDVMQATGEEPEPEQTGVALVADMKVRGWNYSPEQIQFRNTVLLDLTPPEEDILKQMKQKTRYNIRLAGRREVIVRDATPDDYDVIAGMYATTSERNEFAIRPKSYYLDVWKTFDRHGMFHMLIAEYDGQPLAAVIIIHNGDRALYMYGASSDAERNRMPTYLLQWEAIKWSKAAGCTVYDFWGAPDDFEDEDRMWGVWKFKRGFNATVARHVGAWDYPVWPPLYKLFTDLLPRYREMLGKIKSFGKKL